MTDENNPQPAQYQAPYVQYAPPPFPPPPPPPEPKGFALTALIVGIVAFIFGWSPFFGAIVGALAVIFGILGLSRKQSKGMSITGLILGGLAFVTSVVVTISFIAIGTTLIRVASDEIANLESEEFSHEQDFDSNYSTEQRQAIEQAEAYLDFGGISEKRLLESLEAQGISEADAQFAIDELDPDWAEQAEKKADSYLTSGPFSKKGLTKQLEYEGFSNDDAKAAVASTNSDWNRQAEKAAREYMDADSFSRSELIELLTEQSYFTKSEAEHGADYVGL
jgi:hypothetical protein